MILSVDLIHFILFEKLHLEFQTGLTIMTGESGAGKSIILDALRIILGDNFNQDDIQHGKDNCEISACFETTHNAPLLQQLKDYELFEENEPHCIIRRTLTRAGRASNYINGHRVTVKQLKEIGSLLVHIHGQHANHSLLKQDTQRDLLDRFLQNPHLCQEVKNAFLAWREVQKKILELKKQQEDPQSKIEWLEFQLNDLNSLSLTENEVEDLHNRQKKLANAEHIINQSQFILNGLQSESANGILRQVHLFQQKTQELLIVCPKLSTALSLLNESEIALREVVYEFETNLQDIDLDAEQLTQIEQRLTKIHDTARKYRVKPEEILTLQQQLTEQLQILSSRDEMLDTLEKEAHLLFENYKEVAQKLSHERIQSAKKLSKIVTSWLQTLGMNGGKLIAECVPHLTEPHEHGIDEIQFLVITNPGNPEKPLAQIASGGEISRMSLAIQVTTQHVTAIPTLIFDEVDIGISGSTAESVGKVLQELAKQTQILTVTHLPQVASLGDHHFKMSKSSHAGKTLAHIQLLSSQERIAEIARLVSGSKITEQTLAHARELLNETV